MVLQGKIRPVRSLKGTFVRSGSSGFSKLEILQAIWSARSSTDIGVCIYNDEKPNGEGTNYYVVANGDYDYGLRLLTWDGYATVTAGFVMAGNLTSIKSAGVTNWNVTEKSTYSSISFSSGRSYKMHNYVAPASYHPALDGSDILKVGETITSSFLREYRLADVLDLGITEENDVFIYSLSSGKTYLFKCDKGTLPAIIVDEKGLATFADLAGYRKDISGYIEDINLTEKKTISWDSVNGSDSKIYANLFRYCTCDIVDESGNVIFAKNANIEDFI